MLKRISATALAALGLALALYLTALKLAALPCVGGGGCGAVIGSKYGAVFGVPVGVFAAALWLTAIFIPKSRVSIYSILAAGSVGFVALQLFVLQAFCVWCTTHAVVTWIVWALRKEEPRRIAAVVGVAFGMAGYALTRHAAEAAAQHVKAPTVVSSTASEPIALASLGPLTPKSPTLVLSLTCPACLDKLTQLTQGRFTQYKHGPALYWKTHDNDRDLTALFVAAVEAQGGGRDAFISMAALVLTQRDMLLSNPSGAAAWLRSILPDAIARVPAAEALLARQAKALTEMGAETTPLLLVPDNAEGPRAHFPIEEIFPLE